MDNKVTTCPKCLGVKEIMEPKETTGFEYRICNLCKGKGEVTTTLADDFVLSINEDNLEIENDW